MGTPPRLGDGDGKWAAREPDPVVGAAALPVFGNGEPVTAAKLPLVGSYQVALLFPAILVMSTVIVRLVGM